MSSYWLNRPAEGSDWSLIPRTDKNGYKMPGCSAWAPSLQKPEVQEAATAAGTAAAAAAGTAAAAATKKKKKIFIKSSPKLSVYPDPHLHSSRERERGKGGRKKKKKNPTT